MKYLTTENFVKTLSFLRRYISAAYITMFVAAFLLWYITKLGETYTTEHKVTVVIDGEEYGVDCTIRGKGTDLIGYTMSSSRSRFTIATSELSFDKEVRNSDGSITRHLSTVSMQQALAARMSDIEVVAVGALPSFTIEGEGGGDADATNTDSGAEHIVSAPNSVKSLSSSEEEHHKTVRSTKPKSGPVTTIEVDKKDSHIKY